MDTRALPFCWGAFDLDWAIPPTERRKLQCFMGCNQLIYEDMMVEHTGDYTACNPQVGVAAAEQGDSVGLGGSQVRLLTSVLCFHTLLA